ncbi:unnamed protein product [Closterium sp. NIES-65]|nr:unnamed protein product [Closterium sp. NIES-65]
MSLTAGQASARFSAAVSVRPVVQIAGGHCYLLGLTCAKEPHGRSVWSIGCGLGGKLGHGTNKDDSHGSRRKLRPAVKACHVAAGDYTTFVVGEGGEVWSFGSVESACLGHGGGWEREEEEEGEEIDDVDLHDIVLRQHRRRNRDVMQPRRMSLSCSFPCFSYPSCIPSPLHCPLPPHSPSCGSTGGATGM